MEYKYHNINIAQKEIQKKKTFLLFFPPKIYIQIYETTVTTANGIKNTRVR